MGDIDASEFDKRFEEITSGVDAQVEGVDRSAETDGTEDEQDGDARYSASIFPLRQALDPKFAAAVIALEKALKRPVWLLLQGGSSDATLMDSMSDIGPRVAEAFFRARNEISAIPEPILLIHSRGGYGKEAYRISRLFQKQCGGFTAIVPRRAKSAATLLAIGADEIIMGPFAELGPLDAQMVDYDRELPMSALDEANALERLHASSLEVIDQLVVALIARTQKKIDNILPAVLSYVAESNKPLVKKIDIVHFTQMSRVLKEAEEYAKRLLRVNYPNAAADHIASQLVSQYPTHGFMIDYEEAKSLGLNVAEAIDEAAVALDALNPFLDRLTVLGKLERIENSEEAV